MTYTSLTAESASAAVAVSRNAGIVTRRVAPESTSWWWTSPDVYVGLTVVSTPPASATAWKTTPYSATVGRHHGDDLALREPALQPTARLTAHRVLELAVRHRPAGGPIDEGGLAGQPAGPFQRVRRQRHAQEQLTDGSGLVNVIVPAPSLERSKLETGS